MENLGIIHELSNHNTEMLELFMKGEIAITSNNNSDEYDISDVVFKSLNIDRNYGKLPYTVPLNYSFYNYVENGEIVVLVDYQYASMDNVPKDIIPITDFTMNKYYRKPLKFSNDGVTWVNMLLKTIDSLSDNNFQYIAIDANGNHNIFKHCKK